MPRTRNLRGKRCWHAICENSDVMTPQQVEIVQATWRLVLPIGDTAAEFFYGKLFSLGLLAKTMRDAACVSSS